MKPLKLAVSVFAIFFSVTSLFAQEIIISGSQKKSLSGDEDAVLQSLAVKIEKDAVVTEISGNNEGFWISGNNGFNKNYYYANDDSVIGLVLKPGSYRIYPNIPKNKTEASVSIKLVIKKKK